MTPMPFGQDRGANIRVMSSHIWETLGKRLLTPIDLTFFTFFKTETPYLGVENLKMGIQDEPFYIKSYVVNKAISLEDMILGQS